MLDSIISSKTLLFNNQTGTIQLVCMKSFYKMSHLLEQEKVLLADELERPVNIHLMEANEITWVEIRRNLEDETQSAIVRLLDALSDFELDEGMSNDLVQQLENHGRNSLRDKARRIANPMFIMALMRERFQELFSFDSNSVPRIWEENGEIEAARQTAHSASVKILSVLAAIRFVDDNDAIEETLSAAFRIAHEAMPNLNSTNWGQIPQEDTLLDPFWCRVLWSDFLVQTTPIVNQAFEEVWQKKKQNYKKHALVISVTVATGAGIVAAVVAGSGAAAAGGAVAAAVAGGGGAANAARVAALAIGAGTAAVVAGGDAAAVAGGAANAARVAANAARVAARDVVSLIAPWLHKGNRNAQAFGRN